MKVNTMHNLTHIHCGNIFKITCRSPRKMWIIDVVWCGKQQSLHAVCYAACLPDGTADGTPLMQLHRSLVEILFLQYGGDGVFSATLRLMSSPAAPFPLAGSTSAFSLSWEPSHVFRRVGFRLGFLGVRLGVISSQLLLAVAQSKCH